jgi:hypothetical protein
VSVGVVVAGVGVWSPQLPGWDAARAVLRGECAAQSVATRPAPSLLAPNERRRAPDSVLLALEVAQQACAMAAREPRELPAVFASAYGDLAISDYLCAPLAQAPTELSPTKFHNSVHNAPAGYWAIATGSMGSSSAVAAGVDTFASGLLEAALLAASEATPVVYAVYDAAAPGPLADVVPCRSAFAAGFVLAPRGHMPGAALRLRLSAQPAPPLAPDGGVLHAVHRDNPAAASLPLLAALARAEADAFALAAGPRTTLHLEISPWQN